MVFIFTFLFILLILYMFLGLLYSLLSGWPYDMVLLQTIQINHEILRESMLLEGFSLAAVAFTFYSIKALQNFGFTRKKATLDAIDSFKNNYVKAIRQLQEELGKHASGLNDMNRYELAKAAYWEYDDAKRFRIKELLIDINNELDYIATFVLNGTLDKKTVRKTLHMEFSENTNPNIISYLEIANMPKPEEYMKLIRKWKIPLVKYDL